MLLQLSTFLIILILSLDTLFAALGYGVSKIKIPWYSALVLSVICAGIFALSIFLSSFILARLNGRAIAIVGAVTLMALGVFKLSDTLIKKAIRKHRLKSHRLSFSFFHIKLIFVIFADPEEADNNKSNTLSIKEAIFLALALSLDSIVSGLAIDKTANSIWLIFLLGLTINILALTIGYFSGKKIGHHLRYDLSFLGGILLIVLGIVAII